MDGSFAPAKKGATESEKTKRGKGTKWMGGGRRPGCSFGRLPSLCIPGGGQARRENARGDPREAATSCGTPATET